MRILIAALALMASACSPMAEQAPDAATPGQTAEAACAAQGGTLQRVGRMQSVQCIIAYADAGKRCTDGDQCQGDCLAPAASAIPAGQAATGQCAADSNRFGCATRVEDGKADATLCID
ncbi:hypothetical protein [Brevundimonas sp. NIBR11]|uniref:hypothetical protein n=1 Tax=Brevundimonas sp. NIBR11 TaxID=3015999 RepID=UPI0022F12EF6|nr:hypothetical protein [Brevundimonas sp. NIBR11]WGM32081.1 hypothetical protein KKHFBJBL_02332 [Brevundimonas sp. NIBR11]